MAPVFAFTSFCFKPFVPQSLHLPCQCTHVLKAAWVHLLSLFAAPKKESAHWHRPSAFTSPGTENVEEQDWAFCTQMLHWTCFKNWTPSLHHVLAVHSQATANPEVVKIKVLLFCKSSPLGEPNEIFNSRPSGITNYFQVVVSYT